MVAVTDVTNHEGKRELLNALIDDVAALRTSIKAITAKLDADDGVTDTDYADSDPPDATVSKT